MSDERNGLADLSAIWSIKIFVRKKWTSHFCARIERRVFEAAEVSSFEQSFLRHWFGQSCDILLFLLREEKTFCFAKFLTKSLSICWRQLCWRRSQQPHHEKEFIGQQNISAHRNKLFQRNNILCRDTNLFLSGCQVAEIFEQAN